MMAFSEQMTLAFGLRRETAVHLDVEVEAAHAECGVFPLPVFPSLFCFAFMM